MSFLLDAILKDFHYCLEIRYVQDNNVNIKEKIRNYKGKCELFSKDLGEIKF